MDKFRLYKFVLKPSHTKETDWTKIIVAEKNSSIESPRNFRRIIEWRFQGSIKS